MSSSSPFRHPWWAAFGLYVNTARYRDEWLIVGLSNTIRQKPDWEKKCKDQEIVKKWEAEFLAQRPETKYPKEVFEYVIRELKWYDELQSLPEIAAGKFKIAADDKILYSDGAIADNIVKSFSKDAASFESAITKKDYHPGSDDLVVDLLHPSLFHLVYGRTKVISGDKLVAAEFNEEIKTVKKGVAEYGVSKRFQWLPALMKLDSETKHFGFVSYINNLHPIKNSSLYQSIADIFNQVIPGLNLCLSRFQSEEYVKIPIQDYYGEGYAEYSKTCYELIDRKATDEEWEEWEKGKRQFYREVIPKYEKDPETKHIDLRGFENLKVIVKMANIELTPEKPEYKGGSWHVEGTINEDIVATVIYYYDMDNVKDSKLSFKYAFDDPDYEQGDEFYCKDRFGIEDGDPMTRYIGSVEAKKGRVVIFPNSFQHHVDAFKLEDPSKPGFRKILCFFLVDPYNSLVKATDVVPPQNETWVNDKELMKKFFPQVNAKDLATMTEQEAKEFRLQLMEERSAMVNEEDDFDNAYSRTFSLCEH